MAKRRGKRHEARQRCPVCQAKFFAAQDVINHLSQPACACHGVIHTTTSGLERLPPRKIYCPGLLRTENAGEDDSESIDDSQSSDSTSCSEGSKLELDPDGSNTERCFDQKIDHRYEKSAFPGAAETYGHGANFIDAFDQHPTSSNRNECPYFPFASKGEWELACFLSTSGLSNGAINKFLKLCFIKVLKLSFQTAASLQSKIDLLPRGPQWFFKEIPPLEEYPTRKPVMLFYRNPIDCIQWMLQNPLMKDALEFEPFKLFRVAERTMRVYTEWLSGDAAWKMQCIPHGATLLGTILTMDKTHLTAMTGNRYAHPVLLSLANYVFKFRMKLSHVCYLLLCLLPIPAYYHDSSKVRTQLEARLLHWCLDYVLEPVKNAARVGVMMSDPLGYRRYCFTPLAACTVDLPEAQFIACVGNKTSPITTASGDQLGDGKLYPPRVKASTLSQIAHVTEQVDLKDVQAYAEVAFQEHRLNAVTEPFWRDWPLSSPNIFLPPDPLHYWHRFFYDHPFQWCKNAVGAAELDFRFSLLQPRVGYRHFGMVTRLKQVTGREHRDLQRFIIPVCAGAVPKAFIRCIRSLLDFIYTGQATLLEDGDLEDMQDLLGAFHDLKGSVSKLKARLGAKGKPINDFNIPKLELMQSVTLNVRENGVPLQYTTDISERAHIPLLKVPVKAGNNRNDEITITKYLDRLEGCRTFDLAMAMREAGVDFRAAEAQQVHDKLRIEGTDALLEMINSVLPLGGSTRDPQDNFERAGRLESQLAREDSSVKLPLRTFTFGNTAFHLTRDPIGRRKTAQQIISEYNLPDFPEALHAYIQRCTNDLNQTFSVTSKSGYSEVSETNTYLAHSRHVMSQQLEVWHSFRIQSRDYHDPSQVMESDMIMAEPPSEEWKKGRYDTVIINTDPSKKWPYAGMEGHEVVKVLLIFRIVESSALLDSDAALLAPHSFLLYAEGLDIVDQHNYRCSPTKGRYPEYATDLYHLKKARGAGGNCLRGIVPIRQARALADVTPQFGESADPRLTTETSLHYSKDFWLNKYFTKQLFFALTTTRKDRGQDAAAG